MCLSNTFKYSIEIKNENYVDRNTFQQQELLKFLNFGL